MCLCVYVYTCVVGMCICVNVSECVCVYVRGYGCVCENVSTWECK